MLGLMKVLRTTWRFGGCRRVGNARVCDWDHVGDWHLRVFLIIALSLSYRKFLQDKHVEKRRASESLYMELKDALEGLDDEKFPDNVLHVALEKDDGSVETLYLMNRSLNHDFYDSLIFSGQINFLEPRIRQSVQDLFKLFKLHNECLLCIEQSMEQAETNTVPKAHTNTASG